MARVTIAPKRNVRAVKIAHLGMANVYIDAQQKTRSSRLRSKTIVNALNDRSHFYATPKDDLVVNFNTSFSESFLDPFLIPGKGD